MNCFQSPSIHMLANAFVPAASMFSSVVRSHHAEGRSTLYWYFARPVCTMSQAFQNSIASKLGTSGLSEFEGKAHVVLQVVFACQDLDRTRLQLHSRCHCAGPRRLKRFRPQNHNAIKDIIVVLLDGRALVLCVVTFGCTFHSPHMP